MLSAKIRPIALASVLLCLEGAAVEAVAVEPALQAITLTFQDSSGGFRKTLSPDSLPGNLRAYLAALRALRIEKSRRIPVPGESAGAEALLDDCMCESPSDSLLIRFADGTREAYEVYCGEARRLQGKVGYPMEFPQAQRERLADRWNSLRRRFCPGRYGCSKAAPAKWSYHSERRSKNGWEVTTEVDRVADVWTGILDSTGALAPEAPLSVTLRFRDGKLLYVSNVRVPPGYEGLVPTFIRGTYHQGKWLRNLGSGDYRVNAYNFDNER